MAEIVYGMSREVLVESERKKETILVSIPEKNHPSECWNILTALGENALLWMEPWKMSADLDEAEKAKAFYRGSVSRVRGQIREIEAQKFDVREGKGYKPLPNKVALSA